MVRISNPVSIWLQAAWPVFAFAILVYGVIESQAGHPGLPNSVRANHERRDHEDSVQRGWSNRGKDVGPPADKLSVFTKQHVVFFIGLVKARSV